MQGLYERSEGSGQVDKGERPIHIGFVAQINKRALTQSIQKPAIRVIHTRAIGRGAGNGIKLPCFPIQSHFPSAAVT